MPTLEELITGSVQAPLPEEEEEDQFAKNMNQLRQLQDNLAIIGDPGVLAERQTTSSRPRIKPLPEGLGDDVPIIQEDGSVRMLGEIEPKDRFAQGSPAGRIAKEISNDITALYEGDLGLSSEHVKHIKEVVFPTLNASKGSKSITEGAVKIVGMYAQDIITGTPAILDSTLRLVAAPFVGGFAAIRGTMMELGMSRADADDVVRLVEAGLIQSGVEAAFVTRGQQVQQVQAARREAIRSAVSKKATQQGKIFEPKVQRMIEDSFETGAARAEDSLYQATKPQELAALEQAATQTPRGAAPPTLAGGAGRGGGQPPPPPHSGGRPGGQLPRSERPLVPPNDTLRDALLRGATEPIFREDLSAGVVRAATALLTEGKVPRNESLPLFLQVHELLVTNRLSDGTIRTILERNNVRPQEFLDNFGAMFQQSISSSGRRLNELSQMQQRINRSFGSGEATAELDAARRAAGFDTESLAGGFWRGVAGVPRQFMNVWRGMLVTQMATAARNFETQIARVGLDVMGRGMERGLNRFFNPTAHATGSPIDAMGELSRMLHPRNTKKNVNTILEPFPKQYDRMFMRFSSDVDRSTGFLANPINKAVDFLNILNRAQEFIVRRAVFEADLARRVAVRGDDLYDIIKNNQVGRIHRDDMNAAVEHALEATFAASPKGTSNFAEGARGLIQFINSTPPLGFAVPFPRFMYNALKFQTEFSPLGFLQLFGDKTRARVAAGDHKATVRASMGSAMWLTAYQMRSSDLAKNPAGERGSNKWYEITVGDKTIDTRPFNPFAASLFVGDLIVKARDGQLDQVTSKDVRSAVLGMASRGLGTIDFAVDKTIQALADGESRESGQALLMVKETLGDIGAGFLTPLRTLRDFAAAFDDTVAIVRDSQEDPLLDPLYAELPGGFLGTEVKGLTELRPAVSPVRPDYLKRENTLLRQTTGITVVQPKTPLQAELDRFGFDRGEIQKSSGNPEWDRLVSIHMAPIMHEKVGQFLLTDEYLNAVDSMKAHMLKRAVGEAASLAARRAEAEAPGLAKQVQLDRKGKRFRKAIREEIEKPNRARVKQKLKDAGLQFR